MIKLISNFCWSSNIESHNHSLFGFLEDMATKFYFWASLLAKVLHIDYTIAIRTLPDIIHTCSQACGPRASAYTYTVYQGKHPCT